MAQVGRRRYRRRTPRAIVAERLGRLGRSHAGSRERSALAVSEMVSGPGAPQITLPEQRPRPRYLRPVLLALFVLALGLCAVCGISVLKGSGGVELRRSDSVAAETSHTAAGQDASVAITQQAVIVVHVDGAVASPGVYELPADEPRVNDAIVAAGGLDEDADTSALNLASLIVDGSKVHVPRAGDAVTEGSATAGAASSTSGGTASGGSTLVNINTATAEELDTLPGVGPSTAETIIKDREANGPFASIEDLMRVSGIGEKKFANLKDGICV